MRIVPAELHELPPCPCCGKPSRLVCGNIFDDARDDDTMATYEVHWTDGPRHEPHVGFYIVYGPRGGESKPRDRYAVALEVIATGNEPFIAVFDANTAPIANDPDVGRALRGAEVAGTPLADVSMAIVHRALADDPRLAAFAARRPIARD